MGDPPLDEVGEQQAATLASDLAPLRPVWVASSDLERARATASVVAARCGTHVKVDPSLREVDLGGWEGLTHSEVRSRLPEEYRRWRDGEDIRRGGGETCAEAACRFSAALQRLASTLAPGATGVVVAHGVVLQHALDALASAGLLLEPNLSAGAPHLANGAWMALDLAALPAERLSRDG